MKLIGRILIVGLILAALRVALAVIFAVYLALLMLSLILHPRETLGIFAFWFLCAMLECYPLITIGVVLAIGMVCRLETRKRSGLARSNVLVDATQRGD